MKRTHEEHRLPQKIEESSPISSTSHLQSQTKRQKSSHACSSCRKHKTRCEQIDGNASGSQRCHRCNVLNMPCSFDLSATPVASSKESPSTPGLHMMLELHSPPDSPTSSVRCMNPEDLVQTPITPWGFLKGLGGFDWTATPMLALQELARRPSSGQTVFTNPPHLSLAGILTEDQTLFLLEIFNSRYSPWLDIPPSQGAQSPLLDLVRCTVASRHLDIITRSIVAPRLQKMSEDIIFKEIFNPIPSTESIHALLIMALWSPISGIPQSEVRDGRLLAASAVSMAMNLRLSQASVYVNGLQERKKAENGLSAANAQDLSEAMEKAHLWICLTNVESMLCIGTGRTPLSQRSDFDNKIISSCILTIDSGREMRLGLMAQLFDLAQRGHRIIFSRYLEMDKWHKEVLDVLVKMESLHRIILPLPVVAEQDAFHYHMLLFYYHFCRLLVLHQAMREARRVLQDHYPGKLWHKEFVHQGVNLALIWGQEAILTAEAVLVASLSRSESISSAPDIVFAMISFAAVWLIIAKFAIYQNRGEHLPGASDGLLTKVIERLSQSALAEDHTPVKCAQVVIASFKAFEKRTSSQPGLDIQDATRSRVGHTVSAERLPSVKLAAPEPSSSRPEGPHPADTLDLGSHHEYSFMNSDIFLDTDFWSSFMDNLSTNVPNA